MAKSLLSNYLPLSLFRNFREQRKIVERSLISLYLCATFAALTPLNSSSKLAKQESCFFRERRLALLAQIAHINVINFSTLNQIKEKTI